MHHLPRRQPRLSGLLVYAAHDPAPYRPAFPRLSNLQPAAVKPWSGLRRARQPLGMLGGGTGSAARRARPPFPRAAAATRVRTPPGRAGGGTGGGPRRRAGARRG